MDEKEIKKIENICWDILEGTEKAKSELDKIDEEIDDLLTDLRIRNYISSNKE